MSIITGQDSRLQVGLANTWKTPTKTKQRLPFTTEGFKGQPNYKESDALVGASGLTSMAIMSFKANGSFSTYVTADALKLFLFAALGAEGASTVYGSDGQYSHKFTPIPASQCANLPSLTVEIDRLMEKALYLNYKLNTWKISGKSEDYITFECDGPAYKEVLQDSLGKCKVVGYVGLTMTVTLETGLILANDQFNGKIAKISLSADGCGNYVYGRVIDTVLADNTVILGDPGAWWGDELSTDNDAYNGLFIDFLNWEMAPEVPLSSLEYLRFVHGRLTMDSSFSVYRCYGKYTGTNYEGVEDDIVLDVPIAKTGAAGLEIYVEAEDTQGAIRVYKYIGAAITRSAETLTFADTPVGVDNIKSIFTAGGVLNDTFWEVAEEMYDEITDFTINGENGIPDSLFGLNGSMFSTEVNPAKRDFSLDVTSRFTTRLSELRKKRMMTGVPVDITLVFETSLLDGPFGAEDTSVDGTGNPYRVEFHMPKCYYTEGIANISGADEPTISPKFRCAETINTHKAIEVTVIDDKNHTVAGGDWIAAVREDGYAG